MWMNEAFEESRAFWAANKDIIVLGIQLALFVVLYTWGWKNKSQETLVEAVTPEPLKRPEPGEAAATLAENIMERSVEATIATADLMVRALLFGCTIVTQEGDVYLIDMKEPKNRKKWQAVEYAGDDIDHIRMAAKVKFQLLTEARTRFLKSCAALGESSPLGEMAVRDL